MYYFQDELLCLFLPFFIITILCDQDIPKAAELPKVLPIKDDKKIMFATAGQQFSLKCPVKDRTAFVDWLKGNESLYLTDGYSMSETGALLKIKNVTLSHEGIYTCHVINGHGTVSINFTVIVNNIYPKRENIPNKTSMLAETIFPDKGAIPVIEKGTQNKQHELKEQPGAFIEIQCKSSGYPAPDIVWLKNGAPISKDLVNIVDNSTRSRTESTILLKNLQKTDSGTYSCIAINRAGEDKLDFVLSIMDPLHPPEIISVKPRNSSVSSGHTVVLKCKGKNLPGVKVHIKWMKTIPEHEKKQWKRTFHLGKKYYRVLDTTEDPIMANDGRFLSELVISNATFQDAGSYVCLAVNNKGYEFKEASLNVVAPVLASPYASPSVHISMTIIIVFSASIVLALFIGVFSYCWCRSIQKAAPPKITDPTASESSADRKCKRKNTRGQLIV